MISAPRLRPPHLSAILLFALILSAEIGCSEDKETLILEKAGERVAEYRKKRQADCLRNLLVKAEQTVDSILLAEAKQALEDSLMRFRPFRPTQPPPIPAIDSLNVAPLFKLPPKQ